MAMSRNEEIIFREVQALAGDMDQISKNMTRDHEERLKQAEEYEQQMEKKHPGRPLPGLPMRSFDKVGLLADLHFIKARFDCLFEYLGEPNNASH